MIKEFPRKVQFPVMLACGAAPLSALLFALLAPQALQMAWLLPVAMIVLSVPCLLLRKGRLWVGLALGLGYIAGGIFMVRQICIDPWLTAVPVFYGLLLLYTVPMGSWPWHREPPMAVSIIGIILHIAAQLTINHFQLAHNPALEPVQTGLLICFLIFAFLLLLSRNRSSLASASQEKPVIPRSTRLKNVLMVVFFFLLLALLSRSAFLTQAVTAALRAIAGVLAFLATLRSEGDELPTETVVTEPPEDMGNLPTTQAGGALQNFLLAAFRFLLPFIVVVFFILVLFLLFKYSSKLFKSLGRLLQRFTASATADYEEQITDTRDSPDPEATPKRIARLQFLPGKRLSPAENIRRRYRQLKKRNTQWTSSSTARENLPEDAAPLYEQARYSENPVTAEDAAEFAAKTKRI